MRRQDGQRYGKGADAPQPGATSFTILSRSWPLAAWRAKRQFEVMLYLEDMHEGDRTTLGPIEVSREDALDFARRYDPQPFHLDDAAASAHPFFKRLAISGWQTCALAMRLMVDDMQAREAQSLGSPGIDQIRWLRPVHPGDRLMLEAETLEVKRSRSRPEMGSVRRRWTMSNQLGEAVMTMEGVGLFAARGAGPG